MIIFCIFLFYKKCWSFLNIPLCIYFENIRKIDFNRCKDMIVIITLLSENYFGLRSKNSSNGYYWVSGSNCSCYWKKWNYSWYILDFSKTFDTVDHDILLFKLDWCKSYLVSVIKCMIQITELSTVVYLKDFSWVNYSYNI